MSKKELPGKNSNKREQPKQMGLFDSDKDTYLDKIHNILIKKKGGKKLRRNK
jgi:hypothetical protein